MASDAPEDGDPPTLPGPSAGSSAAFAATLAPERSRRPGVAEGSGGRPAELAPDELVDAERDASLGRERGGASLGGQRAGASLGRVRAGRATPMPRAADGSPTSRAADGSPTPRAADGSSTHAPTRRLLPSALESEPTLDAPVIGELPPLPIVADTSYLAIREVARGGMGRIVAAEDQRLGRTVALKELLDPAAEQRGRFQREALITARLQHPGIVPVYEAGRWPSGEPFFAMKLVQGKPLDRVIAAARTLEARLALLPRIAAATDAMAYAHAERVIHRDLKPANVLIGEYGETVVIDWGLAKNLDELDRPESQPRARTFPLGSEVPPPRPDARTTGGSTLTVAGSVMGTPAYMAPEQARGEPVDQRADVFALGAMLYHLLAGVPPYNARTATDVIAAAAVGKVVPLTQREPGAPPDLVAIVERAMAALPIDRYADAGELASELRRFLTGQLVSAHRYTAGQRINRFVHRHRAAVTIAALAALGFAAGGTFAVRRIVHERDVADRQRSIADTRRQAAEHLIDNMLSDVRTKLAEIGRLDLLASLGSEIRNYYDTLAKVPGGMPADDLDRMALAVDLVGLAERDSGKLDEALATWTGVRGQLADAVAAGGPSTRLKRRMIARLDFEIGTVHQQRGAVAAALGAYTQAKHQLDALRAEEPGDRITLLGAAEAHDRIGDLLRNEGKVDQAFEEYSEAKTEREQASNGPTGRPQEELLALSTSHLKLGSVYQARGESAKALDEYRASLRLREGVLAAQRDNVEVQNKLLEVELTLGDLQRQAGDPRAAIETYRKAVPVMDALGHRDPANATWQRLRGNIESDYGFALLDAGDHATGRAQLAVAIATQEALVARDPRSTTWQADLSRSYTRLGDAELYLGDADKAIATYRRALDSRDDLVALDPTSKPYRRSVAWSHFKLAGAYAAKNDPVHALESHERALAVRAALVDESPGQGGYRNELAASEVSVGRLVAASDPARSARLLASGVARARQTFAADPINNDSKATLVQALLAEADAARATHAANRAAILGEALATARAAAALAPTNVHWAELLAEIHAGLGELAAARGDTAGALAARAAIRELLEPLARTGRLAAQRKPLLDRAR